MPNPKLIATPFAETGTRNDIPESGASEPQFATMQAGFPSITQQPLPVGIPPERADFNGAFHLTTSHLSFLNKGNWYGFDETFAGQIGGYDKNAILMLDNGELVQSTQSGNTNNPNVNMVGWKSSKNNFTIDLSSNTGLSSSNITSLINSSLIKSSRYPIELILPSEVITLTSKIELPSNSKGVILNLNGATLRAPSVGSVPSFSYLINAMCPESNLLIIENGILDGSLRDQNLFQVTNPSELGRGCSGISAQSRNVIFRNLIIQNMYGQTTLTVCRNFQVEDVFIDNCGGHWYQNDGYDSFGDAFYIGTGWNTNGVINVDIKNTTVVAKHSDQYPENHQSGTILTRVLYSRIGVTLERYFGTNQNDVRLNMENCDFQFLERGFHQEGGNIKSYLSLKNTRFNSCVLFGAYLTQTMESYSEFCDFGFYGSDYNGSKGLVRSFDGTSNVIIDRSSIRNLSDNTNQLMFGLNGKLALNNCTVYDISGVWGSGVTMDAKNTKIFCKAHSSLTYLFWDSLINFDGVDVSYTGTDTALKTYSDQLQSIKSLKKCSFDRILLNINTLQSMFDSNVLIVPDDNSTSFIGTRWRVVNKSGNILNYPCILWGVPESVFNDNRYYTTTYSPTGPINIINNSSVANFSRRCSLFLIVVKGHADAVSGRINNISQSAYGQGYYIAVAKFDDTLTNKVRVLTDFISVGSTTGAGYGLTITRNGDVSGYGGFVVGVHVAFIPESFIYTVPYVPVEIQQNFNKGAAVENPTATDNTANQLTALLTSLRNAGYISQ